jgi:hypothetical protein
MHYARASFHYIQGYSSMTHAADLSDTQIKALEDWKLLVQEWIAVKRGGVDKRHGGDNALWKEDIRKNIPLQVRNPAIPLFAVETKDPDILDIVYKSLTPNSHISYLLTSGLVPCQMTFDTLLAFQRYYNLPLSASENTVLLRRALGAEDDTLFKDKPGFDQAKVFQSLVSDPGLLEYTGKATAPIMAEYLTKWVQINPKHLLSVFLVCAKEGLTKSMNAILAAGHNPFQALGTRNTNFMHSNRQALADYNGPKGLEIWPESFRKVLRVLDPETQSSNHERLILAEIYAPGALQSILASDPKARIGGVSPEDWTTKTPLAANAHA